jgi:chaperonin GroEL
VCINAGLSEDILIQQVTNTDDTKSGYDFRNHEMCDMYESGIVDPVKVTKTALTNAVSAASTLLNTNHAIIQIE